MAIKSPFKIIIVYDLETKGTNPKKHDVTEIAMVAIDTETLEIVGSYESLIKKYSDREYDPIARKVTGISEEMLEDEGENVETVMAEVKNLLTLHKVDNNKPILGGHKIKSFDNGFLEELMSNSGDKLSSYVKTDVFFDSIEEARWMFPDSNNYELGTCCKNVGIVIKEAHRAMNDAMPNAKLIIEMLKRKRGGGSSGSVKKIDHRANFNLIENKKL